MLLGAAAHLSSRETQAVSHGMCQCNILPDTVPIVSLIAQGLSEVINLEWG